MYAVTIIKSTNNATDAAEMRVGVVVVFFRLASHVN